MRRTRLESALVSVGVDVESLLSSQEYRGTAALRAYGSFVLPKSEGALAVAESPQRALVVANSISFYLREHKSHREEWIVNHDRSLREAEDSLSSGDHDLPRLIVILDNLRSAHNVGNILRAAEAARVRHVYLAGITPTPPNPKVLKTAVGAAAYVPHTHVGTALEVVRDLQTNHRVRVWGVETTSRSQSLWKTRFSTDHQHDSDSNNDGGLALIFGNEVVGVHTEVLNECDGLVSVPMMGIKNSLNVATCASIVMWEVLRQWDEDRTINGEEGEEEQNRNNDADSSNPLLS